MATNNKGAPAREGIPMGRYEPMTITRQRRAERELAQRNPAWQAWLARADVELHRFTTTDVPALSRLTDPHSREGLQIAEDAAHDLFECTWSTFLPRLTEQDLADIPEHMVDIVMEYRWQSVREHPELHVQLDITDEHGPLARRWERFVGETFRRAFEGTWLNAPAWTEGPRDASSVLPVIEFPWDPIAPQRYEVRGVLSMAPWMDDWHRRTLQRLWGVEAAPHTAWIADGRPRDDSWMDPGGS